MSGLSDILHTGQTGSPLGCVGTQEEGKGCVGGLEGLAGPQLWTRELRLQEESQGLSNDGLAPVISDHYPSSSPATLANGLHLQRRLGYSGCRRRQTDTHTTAETLRFPETFRDMQTHMDADVHTQAASHSNVDNCGHMDVNAHKGSVAPEHSRTLKPEALHKTSPKPLSVALGSHPASTNRLAAAVLTAGTEMPSPFCQIPTASNPNTGSSSIPVEAEKKYALRSSGRPRFPCHLRKSSRLRRGTEDGERRTGKERVEEEEEVLEELWRVKEEEVAVGEREDLPVEAILPTAPCPTDITSALTVPKPVPKAMPKPGPRLGHRPGPKSRSRPTLKSVHKAAPKSVMKKRQAAQSATLHTIPPSPFANTSSDTTNLLSVKEKPVADLGVPHSDIRRRGRFVGVRKIVVKVARIPVSLSRRQKSYKISNLETVTGTEKGHDGGLESSEVVREPTALLRMKNNGKSVMVMFPPGELPVILKRRRGRPPKQSLPGIIADPQNPGNAGGTGEQPKKLQRRRRTKLPSPYPSYVNDTNDVKTEYGDVLSKLAFLNRQPLTTGRSSPPRCWTPSEPESFHTPLENPGLSTLLHRLTGFRRPRGGRGGGSGRGGGIARGNMCNKSTFSDFFESIGKKRKPSALSEHGLPRKRGKGVGAVGRGGGIVGTEPGGEKLIRKRRVRKNGAFKGEVISMGQDWPNGACGWGEEGHMDREKGFVGYQLFGSSMGVFSSCDVGRGGVYSSPGGSRGGGPAGDDSQGLFAGYFRSLLDSDDSSDLLDISSQSNPRKALSTPGFEPSSPATGHRWSPAFPKWNTKGDSSGVEGSAQVQCSTVRPPYSYSNLAQTSPTTSTYAKSNPPTLSHSPSSPHMASYGHFSSGYNSSSPVGPHRSSDCSFAYGSGHSSGKATIAGQLGYSNYQAAVKRGYSGYPAAVHSSILRGESTGPTSPGGGFMSVAKSSPFTTSSSPDGYKQYNSSQWGYRQGFGGWSPDNFGHQYPGYVDYGSNESKDILDISNYTPQKAKRQPFLESLSESSSDSSHPGSAATGGGPSATCGIYKQSEAASVSGDGGQSSLSSLEKLMMDWHESASGPSYNWSQNVLFQGGGTGKPGRGRRKRTEPQSEKEGGSVIHTDSPSSPSPTTTPGPKRGGIGGRGRGSRGGRGGLSPCQRERPSGTKGRGKAASTSGAGAGGALAAGGPEGSGLFQEGLDYYSGDSSSLSPMATPNPAPPATYLQDPCEYPSPYSAHPSTPSSEERYPALYPGESSSLSPSVSSPPYPPKPTPPPHQSYHPVPSRTFSPSCSPSPRVNPHCGTALSPPHRPPPKDPQFSQYDSPSYCSSPYWYGPTSHSSSPSPHSHSTHTNTAVHTHNNQHTSPHGNTLASPNGNTHTHMNSNSHDTPHHNTQPHANTHSTSHLQSSPLSHSNPHTNNHHTLHNTHTHPNSHLPSLTLSNPSTSLHSHSTPVLYEECSPPSTMGPHKLDLAPLAMNTAHRQGPLPPSPYPKPPLDRSPHQDDTSGFSLSHQSYPGMGHCYPSQAAQGGGVLCQLLDPANDDSFSVTSL